MVLGWIWIGFFVVAFVVGLCRLLFFGDTEGFPEMMGATFTSAKTAFEISLGLTGTLALWMGIMRIGERGGVVEAIARLLSPLLCRLFPGVPKGHPVFGHIFMNISANMLGLDNAATPIGLRAMKELQELNQEKERASDAMIMFLVLNTSGLTLIPVSILVYRAQMGAAMPTDVFLPILIATAIATLAGIVITSLWQRISLLNKGMGLLCLTVCLLVGLAAWAGARLPRETLNTWSGTIANVLLFLVIILFIGAGIRRRVNVYEAFIEGAKGGFSTAVRIIPYLVAILVAVAVFRASGSMDCIIKGAESLAEACGLRSDWVAALPTALMKPLSGSGARGMMVDAMATYGADSFAGRLSCIFQGATDTTFYILAVYFGSVGVRRTRHAVAAGLLTDLVGVLAAIAVAYIFFG
ncbi:MAG: hypothetical protein LUI09_01005 [Prevotellaceae bacterium]|nr:hypothetical protein [Prevotellaceae bacterium]